MCKKTIAIFVMASGILIRRAVLSFSRASFIILADAAIASVIALPNHNK
jgi:hypothetical protein